LEGVRIIHRHHSLSHDGTPRYLVTPLRARGRSEIGTVIGITPVVVRSACVQTSYAADVGDAATAHADASLPTLTTFINVRLFIFPREIPSTSTLQLLCLKHRFLLFRRKLLSCLRNHLKRKELAHHVARARFFLMDVIHPMRRTDSVVGSLPPEVDYRGRLGEFSKSLGSILARSHLPTSDYQIARGS
jgi:hypothetical protein